MASRNYDAKQVQVVIGGVAMEGFQPGSFVAIAYNEDQYKLIVGPDGSTTRSRTNNLSARVTLRLQQSSPSNDVLTGLFVADGESPVGAPVPIMVKDASGRSLFVSESAWIVKLPDSDYGTDPGERAWTIETDALVAFIGGNQ